MPSTKLTVMKNGSIRVEGDFEIVDQDGTVFGIGGRARLGLCRCGHSANKPFCDGAHKAAGFEPQTLAFDLPPAPPKPAV